MNCCCNYCYYYYYVNMLVNCVWFLFYYKEVVNYLKKFKLCEEFNKLSLINCVKRLIYVF